MHQQDEGFGVPEVRLGISFDLICYLFLNVLKIEISEDLRFFCTDAVSVVALSGFRDDCLIRTPS